MKITLSEQCDVYTSPAVMLLEFKSEGVLCASTMDSDIESLEEEIFDWSNN